MELKWSIKGFALDQARLNAAKDRSINRGITRGLRFIRTRARTSIRRRKGPSKPGQPPSAHTRGPGIKTIFWEFDPFRQSGAVGPVKLNGQGAKPQVTVPNALETGGAVTFPAGSWIMAQDRDTRGRFTEKRPRKLKKKRRVRIKPRPFMVPAMEHEVAAGNVAGAFTGTFTE